MTTDQDKHIYRVTRALPDGACVMENIPGQFLVVANGHVTIGDGGIVFSARCDQVLSVRDITRIGREPEIALPEKGDDDA